MLGWEYPPHISGGLGTACEGLTTALAPRGVEIDFLVPKLYGGGGRAAHAPARGGLRRRRGSGQPVARAASPARELIAAEPARPTDPIVSVPPPRRRPQATQSRAHDAPAEVRMLHVPAMLKPYLDQSDLPGADSRPARCLEETCVPGSPRRAYPPFRSHRTRSRASSMRTFPATTAVFPEGPKPRAPDTTATTSSPRSPATPMSATRRVAGQKYDLVHAHDWMTFPAGIEIAQRAGAPLVVHVHSLEYDRAGQRSRSGHRRDRAPGARERRRASSPSVTTREA